MESITVTFTDSEATNTAVISYIESSDGTVEFYPATEQEYWDVGLSHNIDELTDKDKEIVRDSIVERYHQTVNYDFIFY